MYGSAAHRVRVIQGGQDVADNVGLEEGNRAAAGLSRVY